MGKTGRDFRDQVGPWGIGRRGFGFFPKISQPGGDFFLGKLSLIFFFPRVFKEGMGFGNLVFGGGYFYFSKLSTGGQGGKGPLGQDYQGFLKNRAKLAGVIFNQGKTFLGLLASKNWFPNGLGIGGPCVFTPPRGFRRFPGNFHGWVNSSAGFGSLFHRFQGYWGPVFPQGGVFWAPGLPHLGCVSPSPEGGCLIR